MMRNFWFAITTAVLTHLADVLVTYMGLQRGFPEGNPIAVYLIAKFGFVPAALITKGIAVQLHLFLLANNGYSSSWLMTFLTLGLGVIPWIVILSR